MKVWKECSYGIIPLRKVNSDWEVLLVKHKEGHWSFPKGHPEEGESPVDTAKRELFEETGLTVDKILSDEPLKESYSFTREEQQFDKTVYYYIAETQGNLSIQSEELSQGQWFPLEKSEEQATFPEAKRLCRYLTKRFY